MRTKNSVKTFVWGVFFTVIIAVLGLFKTKVLLQYLGAENVGIYQLFFQIFTYLSLADGGLTAGVTYCLYKPISDNDYQNINAILNGAKSYFRKIGYVIIVLGLIISFNLSVFIKSTSLDYFYIQISFILFILASAMSYFVSTHAILYNAEQKLYKANNINLSVTIIKSILEIILVLIGFKLVTLMIMFLILMLLRNLILVYISKKEHRYFDSNIKKDNTFKKETKNLMVRKVSQLIFENTDIILISKFLGLTHVVIYTFYYQIVHMIKLIVNKINSALLPSVGNLLISNKNKNIPIFDEINSLLFFVGSIICIPLYFMLSPFIEIWFGKDYVASNIISLFFVILLYVDIIKIVLIVFADASGNFKSMRKVSVFQSAANLILSIILIFNYEIAGVLLATILTNIIGDLLIIPKVINEKVLGRTVSKYYYKCLKFIIGLSINILITILLFKDLLVNNLFEWLLWGVVIFTLNFIITMLYYYFIKELTFLNRIKQLLKKAEV
ncbi:MAG: oligosaccharide flippase family protein [Bacilli bacterium]